VSFSTTLQNNFVNYNGLIELFLFTGTLEDSNIKVFLLNLWDMFLIVLTKW